MMGEGVGDVWHTHLLELLHCTDDVASVLKKAELAVRRVVRASSDEEKRVVACGALVREAVVHRPWGSRGSHI